MEFQSVVNKRKMIRSFIDKPIPNDILDRILKNIFRGPSAGFSQGIEILVLTDQADRQIFYSQFGSLKERSLQYEKWPTIELAPVIIIVCSHKQTYLDRYSEADKGWTNKAESNWPVPYWDIDSGMAALLALLTVVDSELGAVFRGCKDLDYVRKHFDIPDAYTPIGAIMVGYPEANDPPSPSLQRGRRDLDKLIHRGRW